MNEIHRLDLTQAVPPGVAGRQPKRHGSARLLRTIVLRGLWVILAALVLILATQPVALDAQLLLAGTLVGVLAMMRLLRLSGGIWRIIFVTIAGFVVIRYFVWRTLYTLPAVDDMMSFIPAIMLYGAEAYAITMLAIGVFVVADPVKRNPPPLIGPPDTLPTVDVFVPSYNEDDHILEATLTAAKHMRYPAGRLRIYLLDDGGTVDKRMQDDPAKALEARQRHERLQGLCARLGVNYMTREHNDHAKAGNINAALPHTDGELIVILDADHVPTVEFLERTVGFFQRDPKLFLVQTPHFFINPDPLERNLSTFSKMPSENEMFYGVIQSGLDKWNAAYFCGSAAVMRRSCLEEIGGISGTSITEDAETALELHARGYNSIYVDEPLVAGLQPETFDAFIRQRTRWSQGMTQIFVMKNPIFKRGLTLPQRICYVSSSMFWLFPFARLLFIVIPLIYLFFGLQIFYATVPEFAVYTLPYIFASMMVANMLYGTVRWPFVSELYEYVQSIFTWRAVLGTIISPRRPKFAVTDKGVTLERDMLSPLATPMIFIVGLLVAGLAIGLGAMPPSPCNATSFWWSACGPCSTCCWPWQGLGWLAKRPSVDPLRACQRDGALRWWLMGMRSKALSMTCRAAACAWPCLPPLCVPSTFRAAWLLCAPSPFPAVRPAIFNSRSARPVCRDRTC